MTIGLPNVWKQIDPPNDSTTPAILTACAIRPARQTLMRTN